jgi:hypothetical protein
MVAECPWAMAAAVLEGVVQGVGIGKRRNHA